MTDTAPSRDAITEGPPFALLGLVAAVGGLIGYKAMGAGSVLSGALRSGTLAPKVGLLSAPEWGWLQPLFDTANYFGWVVIALGFGIVIGAGVRALLPMRWLAKTLDRAGFGAELFGAVLGAPLMLCSCCAAPVFEGVYARTRRLGPALALMLAAPALNPAALALTFVLLPGHLATVRLLASSVIVLLVATVLGRWLSPPAAHARALVECAAPDWRSSEPTFVASLREVATRSVPAIVVGALLSAVLALGLPLDEAASSTGGWALVLLVTALAVPMALPTFAEIPLALLLVQAQAPDGAVLAMLVAGPIVNLPSLFTVARAVSARAALTIGAAVFLVVAATSMAVGT